MFHFVNNLFFGLHLIAHPKKKSWSRFIPPMLKIGQNWSKIENYPPQCSTKICTTDWEPHTLPLFIYATQFNHVFTLPISMPLFTKINICQNIDLNFSYFFQKNTKFLSTGGSVPRPKWGTCLRSPKHPPLYISGCASESNHVFALLISKPCFESNNFIKINL